MHSRCAHHKYDDRNAHICGEKLQRNERWRSEISFSKFRFYTSISNEFSQQKGSLILTTWLPSCADDCYNGSHSPFQPTALVGSSRNFCFTNCVWGTTGEKESSIYGCAESLVVFLENLLVFARITRINKSNALNRKPLFAASKFANF